MDWKRSNLHLILMTVTVMYSVNGQMSKFDVAREQRLSSPDNNTENTKHSRPILCGN